MTGKDTTSIDEQIREVLFNWHQWRNYYYSDLQEQVITDDEWIVTRDKIDYDATEKIKALISDQVAEAYRKGYNDNARDCYCDSKGATEGILPHKHLMDDGESHAIRPDIAQLRST